MKHDGNLGYKGVVTPLQKVMLARRSFRKYLEGLPTAEQLDGLASVSREFCRTMGFDAPRMIFVTDPAGYKKVMSAACAGVIGKGNPWLPLAKSRIMIVAACDTRKAPVAADRVLAVAQAAMTLETVVLAAAEMGLATCWMAGINSAEVEKALGLPPGEQVIAISPLGLPPEGVKLLSWDGMAYHIFSKRRKQLSEIFFEEEMPNELA
jgi:nitroreductase